MKSRQYSSEVRAQQAAATRQRILEAAQALFADSTADFTLDRVAADASVSVQTVLRAYGSREKLILEAIRGSTGVLADPPPSVVTPLSTR